MGAAPISGLAGKHKTRFLPKQDPYSSPFHCAETHTGCGEGEGKAHQKLLSLVTIWLQQAAWLRGCGLPSSCHKVQAHLAMADVKMPC